MRPWWDIRQSRFLSCPAQAGQRRAHFFAVAPSGRLEARPCSALMGEINRNRQEALFTTALRSAQHRFATLVLMHCHDCNNLYMAQSCDVHERHCPLCQYGVLSNTVDRGRDPLPIEQLTTTVGALPNDWNTRRHQGW